MQLKRTMVGAAAAGCLTLLAACGSANAPGAKSDSMADMKPMTINYATLYSADSLSGRAIAGWAEEVLKDTDGKVTIKPYYSGSLLQDRDLLSGVSTGVAGAGLVNPSYVPSDLPINAWLGNLGSLPSHSYPQGMLGGAAAVHELQMNNAALTDEWAGHNVKVIWATQSNAGFDLLCNKPVKSLADAKGLRVRTVGAGWIGELEALGMVPVDLSADEAYEGLQRGVIDCVNGNPANYMSYGYWEIAKHYIPVAMSASNTAIQVINLDVWDRLPKDAQAAITNAASKWWSLQRAGAVEEMAKFAATAPQKQKVVFEDPTPLNEVLTKYQEGVVADLVADAPGTLKDPQGLVDEYSKYIDDWTEKAGTALGAPVQTFDPTKVVESLVKATEFDYSTWEEETSAALFAAKS